MRRSSCAHGATVQGAIDRSGDPRAAPRGRGLEAGPAAGYDPAVGRQGEPSRPGTAGGDRPEPPGLGGDRRLQRAIDRLAADTRVEEATGARARRSWLGRQLDEETSLEGVLLDLAERGERVVVHTVGGHDLAGRIETVARDFCGVRLGSGQRVLVRTHAIETVRQVAGAAVTGVDRGAPGGQDFETALAALGEQRPEVSLTTARGQRWSGRLLTVGHDVVRLELEAGGGVVFVPLAAIWEIGLP